jgi:hypothetical protein
MFVHYVGDVYVNFYFKATVWEGEPHVGEPHLCSEAFWSPLTDIPDDTILHIRKMLADAQQGKYFSDVVNDPHGAK